MNKRGLASCQIKHRFAFPSGDCRHWDFGYRSQKNALLEMCIVLLDQDELEGWSSKTLIWAYSTFCRCSDGCRNRRLQSNRSLPTFAICSRENLLWIVYFYPFTRPSNKHIAVERCWWGIMPGLICCFKGKRLSVLVLIWSMHFTCFDTATLAGMLWATVLAKAAKEAGIAVWSEWAHSAIYGCTKTAELFCMIILGGDVCVGWM